VVEAGQQMLFCSDSHPGAFPLLQTGCLQIFKDCPFAKVFCSVKFALTVQALQCFGHLGLTSECLQYFGCGLLVVPSGFSQLPFLHMSVGYHHVGSYDYSQYSYAVCPKGAAFGGQKLVSLWP